MSRGSLRMAVMLGCAGQFLVWQPPGTAQAPYVELTTPLATAPRVVTVGSVPAGETFGPSDQESRWIVTNPFLPVDRKFFEKIYQIASGKDGSLYLAAGSLVLYAPDEK